MLVDARIRAAIRGWPSEPWLAWLDRRFGLYLVTIAAIDGLKWRNGYDFNAYLDAARAVAGGRGAYDATLAAGVGSWGTGQVYISPPFLAHVLAPVSALPAEALFVVWTLISLAALIGATRAVGPETIAHRMTRLVFGLPFIWASVFLGQANLLVVAGLLLALNCRRDALAGGGLALATLLRATPVAFAVVLVLQGRWRALGWGCLLLGAGVLATGPGDWVTFVRVLWEAAALPPLDVPPQASLAAIAPLLRPIVVVVLAAVILLARRVPRERDLLVATAIGLGLVMIPANSWYQWYAFGIVGILLWGHLALWSRRSLVGFTAVGFVLMGWPSTLVALAASVAMLARVLRPPPVLAEEGPEAQIATQISPVQRGC